MRWLILFLFLLTNCVAEQRSRVLNSEQGEPFVSVWQVKAGKGIWLPLVEGYNYDFVVDWGDGSQSQITSADDPHRVHAYAVTGSYTLRISGLVETWQPRFNDCDEITSVPDLGDVGWKSLRYAFRTCRDLSNLQGGYVSEVTDMQEMFHLAWSVVPDVSAWDTANVTDMSSMFEDTSTADPNVSAWDTANVTDMSSMFQQARAADPDVSKWDTANVTNMRDMFYGAHVANPDVSKWNTANVTDMSGMFAIAKAANPDVSKWDVSSVTDMSSMFSGATSANPDVSKWNTANVTNMGYMFSSARAANPDVSNWDTANVTNMSHMFAGAQAAVPDLFRWDFAKVTCYADLFKNVTLPTTTYSNILLNIAATSDKMGNDLCSEEVCVEWENCFEEDGEIICMPYEEDHPCIKKEEILRSLTAGQSKYNAEAAAARKELIDRGWKITDGGEEWIWP